MQFKDYTTTPETIRAYQLTDANMSIVKFEGGSVYSLGLVEFISTFSTVPVAGDYLVYTQVGGLPRLVLKEQFEEKLA